MRKLVKKMPFIEFEEKRINYQIIRSDTRKAIIFVHGAGGTSNTWKNQMKLQLNYNNIALDLPSHGKSENFLKLNMDIYVETVKKLVDTLNFEKVVLCGNAMGGAVIQSVYYEYPKIVSALILIDTGAKLKVSPFILNSIKNNYNDYLASLSVGIFHRKTLAEISKEYTKENAKNSAEVTYKDFEICNSFDTLQKTSTIGVPSLIICGYSDKITPLKYSQYFHDKIPNSELIIIKQAAHMPMLEKPTEVNEAITNFLIILNE
jgi:pimeloyl-ACP methyl ester carboxylesterase